MITIQAGDTFRNHETEAWQAGIDFTDDEKEQILSKSHYHKIVVFDWNKEKAEAMRDKIVKFLQEDL